MVHRRLAGIIAAPHTPFDAAGGLALEQIEAQCELLVRNGVAGAFVCGTTGEGLSLASDERIAVARRWAQAAAGRIAVIVHVGHNAQAEAARLARQAQQDGADAVATTAPTFFRPSTVDELVEFCVPIAAAAGELPFYYYHIPSMTGVRLPMHQFLAAGERIATLAGLKFTDSDLADFGRCLQLADGRLKGKQLDVLFGFDEMLLSALAIGARGAVGSTYNLAAPLYRRLIEAFAAGDLAAAQSAQETSRQMIAVLQQYSTPIVASSKAAMRRLGLDLGGVRPPLRGLDEEAFSRLSADLDRLGFDDFRSR